MGEKGERGRMDGFLAICLTVILVGWIWHLKQQVAHLAHRHQAGANRMSAAQYCADMDSGETSSGNDSEDTPGRERDRESGVPT